VAVLPPGFSDDMALRPTDAPDWATDATHAAGTSDWSGKANKVKPSAGKIAAGFTPDENFAVEYENWALNNHGQWIAFLDGTSYTRGDINFRDDFTGASVSAGHWITDVLGAGSAVNSVDDSAAGGFGAAQLLNGTAASSHAILKTVVLPVGISDFYFSARVRNVGTLSGTPYFGLVSDGGTQHCMFFAKPGSGTWNSIAGGVATAVDSGVAVGSTYVLLEIQRLSGVVTFYINGAQTSQVAFATSLTDVRIYIGHTTAASTAGDLRVDRATFQLLSGVPALSPPAHFETGYSAVTAGTGAGHEYIDVSWTTPFASATGINGYRASVTIYVSDSGPNVGYTIRNKTATGFRIQFDADFNGEVRWRAE
jgi:hypothetical protein